MLGAVLLLASGFLLARAAASVEPSRPPASLRSSCDVSILLVSADQSPSSRAIDKATGGLGWTHAALDGCEIDDDGTHVGLDCRPGIGVQRRPITAIIGGRPHARIHLPLTEGAEVYGCVRGRVGAPFDLLGLLVGPNGRQSGFVCSQLIYDCLPVPLRRRVVLPRGRHVAPNDLARAFGVRGAGDWWVTT